MKSKKVNLPKQTKSKKGEIINRSFSQISSFRDLSLLLKFDMTASLSSVVLLRLPPMLFYFLQTLLYPSCSNSCSFTFSKLFCIQVVLILSLSFTHTYSSPSHSFPTICLLYISFFLITLLQHFFLPNFIFT